MTYAHFTSLKRHILYEHPLGSGRDNTSLKISSNAPPEKKVRLGSLSEQVEYSSVAEHVPSEHSPLHVTDKSGTTEGEPMRSPITLEEIKQVAGVGICRLVGDVGLPQSKSVEFINLCNNLIEMICQRLRSLTITFLENNGVNTVEKHTVDFLNEFQFPGIFTEVSTFPKRKKFLKQIAVSVPEPTEKMLSYREDVRHVRGKHTHIRINETFSYIPIIETLKLIFRNPSNREHLEVSENKLRTVGSIKEYSSFCTGETYRDSEFFQKNPNVIRISLYQDDVELGNALSSRAGINKVSCFNFRIQNFPDRVNSSPKTIFPVIYCSSVDTKKHGYNKILQPLISDLKQLEDGITVYYGSEPYVLKATLAAFVGDTLAVHDVFNLLGPGANLFCRICTISRPMFKEDPHSQHPLRSKIWYDTQLQQLGTGQITSKDCGLQPQGCILNELSNFHVCENYILDVMHDMAEGVVPLTLQLVLSYYITSKNVELDISYINYRINTFAYGYVDKKNKPSANFTGDMLRKPNAYKLKQTSTQNLLLLRSLPFLFGHKVPVNCPYMSLIGHLINIVRILMSPVVSDYMLAELENHISQFQQSFYAFFKRRINKSHHLEHYPLCIRKSGSMKQYNCLAFEQKNKPCKSQTANCRNFKNICKSLAKRQCFTMTLDILDNPYADKIVFKTGKMVRCAETRSKSFLSEYSVDLVFTPANVTVNGVDFRPNLIISLINHNNMMYPTYAIIREIVVINNTINYLVKICKTKDYNNFYEAYEIEILDEERFLQAVEVHQHTTFAFWTPYDSQTKYVSRRFYCQDY